MFLIAPILFVYYELSICPLILNYTKVYLASSLITKPDVGIITAKFLPFYNVVKKKKKTFSLVVIILKKKK